MTTKPQRKPPTEAPRPAAIPNTSPPAARSVRGVRPIEEPRPAWAARPVIVALTDDDVTDDDDDEGQDNPDTLQQPPQPATRNPHPMTPNKPAELATAAAVIGATTDLAKALVETLPTPAPAADLAKAPADTMPATTPAADLVGGLALLDALTGATSGPMLRVFSVKPDGTRGAIIATIPATETPDTIRARIERSGPGEYDLALVNGGRYVPGGSRRMTVDPPASTAPAPAAPAAPAADAGAGMVAAMLERMAAMQATQAQNFERLMLTMAAESKNAQLETMRLALERGGSGGGGGGPDGITRDIIKAAIPIMFAKLNADPLEQMTRIRQFQATLREDPAPDNGAMWASLASALATAAQSFQAPAPAPAARPAPAATQAAAAVPAAEQNGEAAAPAPAPAPVSGDLLRDLVPVLKRLALRQADPGAVLAAIGSLLDESEIAALLPMLARPGAADMLLSAVPDLRDVGEWLRATIKAIAADMLSEAAGNGAAG